MQYITESNKRWRYRRIIAIIAGIALLLTPVEYAILAKYFLHLKDEISLFHNQQYIFGSIILFYIGGATYEDVKSKFKI